MNLRRLLNQIIFLTIVFLIIVSTIIFSLYKNEQLQQAKEAIARNFCGNDTNSGNSEKGQQILNSFCTACHKLAS